ALGDLSQCGRRYPRGRHLERWFIVIDIAARGDGWAAARYGRGSGAAWRIRPCHRGILHLASGFLSVALAFSASANAPRLPTLWHCSLILPGSMRGSRSWGWAKPTFRLRWA